jgi:hypothetical protein
MESDLACVKGDSSMPGPLERAVGDGYPGDASPELEGHPGCSSSQVLPEINRLATPNNYLLMIGAGW